VVPELETRGSWQALLLLRSEAQVVSEHLMTLNGGGGALRGGQEHLHPCALLHHPCVYKAVHKHTCVCSLCKCVCVIVFVRVVCVCVCVCVCVRQLCCSLPPTLQPCRA